MKESIRSIKIMLIGFNALGLLITVPTVLKMLELRNSSNAFEQLVYQSSRGDLVLAGLLLFTPLSIFLVYLGVRLGYYIKNKPKIVIGAFTVNFVIFLVYQILDFENINIMTGFGVIIYVYLLVNILRLVKEAQVPAFVSE